MNTNQGKRDFDLIELNGNLLVSKYGVYIVRIEHGEADIFYYVGQTGDAKYITARSSFYRLAAHLSYGKSTQNQVYAALQKRTDITDRYAFERWLEDASIKMYFFKVSDFQNLTESTENKEIHIRKRRETLALETALLEKGRSMNKILLNSEGVTFRDYHHMEDQAAEIWKILE